MKKRTVNQIRQEVQLRLDHLKKLLRSCKTWDQLDTVDDYCDELCRQFNKIIYDNEPFFGKDKYLEEVMQLRKYFDDEYREEYNIVSDKIFNSFIK